MVPLRAAAVVPAVPAALSLLVVRVRVEGAVQVAVVARALRVAQAQVAPAAPAAREGPEVLEAVWFASRVRRS